MRTASSSPNTGVLAFKPRQVLLSSSSTMKKTTKSDEEPQKTLTLKPRQKTLLLQSIAQYLERNSFSKTLKKFRSEAQIEKDDLKGPSLDLEELCCKYLEMCDHSNTNVYGEKDQDAQEKKSTGSKKTKLKTDNAMTEPNLKSKEKKKSKKNSDSVDQVELRESPVDVPDLSQLDEPNKKHKDKKKKNKEVDNVERCAPQPDDTENAPKALTSEDKSSKSKKNKKQKDDNEKSSLIDSMKDVNMTIKEDANDKKSKGSKKRKRIESEGNDCQLFNEKTVDESKRKKAENLEDANGTKQPMDSNASGRGDKHADKESNLMSSANGNLEGNGTNSDMKSSAKKHASDSAQAKKPFQRVNVEEVVFTDERLQDNSYWAKDGAEAGYGAKAQEVLGQVRGRDFRHEKTKKKRGSYRGGQIDMQSHSIKFNYSDDE